MGMPAARVGDMHVCPMQTPAVVPIPHVGGPILPPCAITVLVGGMPQARVSDLCVCVGPPDVIVKASLGVYVCGLPAARIGDLTAHGGTIVAGMPTVLIGDIAVVTPNAPTVLISVPVTPIVPTDLTQTPASIADAPAEVQLSGEVIGAMAVAWSQSLPGDKSQEFGATLIENSDGTTSVVNPGTDANSGAFTPNRDVPPGAKVMGNIHTHPYSAAEGGNTNVAQSAGDFYYQNYYDDRTGMVQSGDGQFMLMKTDTTPKNVPEDDFKNKYKGYFDNATGNGKDFDEASREAARQTATDYGYAYYEGKGGKLTKKN